MRLKKIMSLVLACAMALSLATVASAADTRIYFVEDFSEYVDTDGLTAIDDFSAKMAYSNTGSPSPTATAPEGASKVYGLYTSNAGPAGQYKTFITNDFGSKAFQVFGDGILGTSNEAYLAANRQFLYMFHTDTPWDFVEKADETLVISYEFDTNIFPGVAAYSAYAGTSHAWFTDASNSAGSNFSVARERHVAGTAASGVEGEEGYVAATAPAQYIVDFPDGQGGASQIGLRNFDNGTAIRMAYGFSKDTDTNAKRYYAINGEQITTSNVVRGPFTTKTKFYAFDHYLTGSVRSSIANVKIYSVKTNDFKVTAETAANVPVTAKTMRIYFSNLVSPVTYAAPVVKADGVAMEEGTYGVGALQNVVGDVGGEIYSYVDVTFDGLKEATTYTVEFPETITNEIGTTLAGKNVATFVTKYPDVKVNSLTIVGAESLIADGSLQATKLALANTTIYNKAVAVIYAVYASNGQLADIAYVNDTVAAEKTAEIETGMKLTTAGTLKTFVWDTMTALKPYTGAVELTIAAPVAAE